MNILTEHDLKQIRLIEIKIGLFKNKNIDLFDFINDLGGLLNALESVDNCWKEDFRADINALEIICDSIEDGSIVKWKGNFKKDIHTSVLKLEKMTICILEEYLKLSDQNIRESAIAINDNWLMCPKCNDAWESSSKHAMVICPKCECAFHNPRKLKFSNSHDQL